MEEIEYTEEELAALVEIDEAIKAQLAKYELSAFARPRTTGRMKPNNELNDRSIDYE